MPSRNDIFWAMDLVDYEEFSSSFDDGLKIWRSIPSGNLQREVEFFSQFSKDEAEKIFRAPYYLTNRTNAIREWGEDPDAKERFVCWRKGMAGIVAKSKGFDEVSYLRLNIPIAKRYVKYRLEMSHSEALCKAFGGQELEVDEEVLNKVGEMELASAKSINKAISQHESVLNPLQRMVDKWDELTRYELLTDRFRVRLQIINNNRPLGGVDFTVQVHSLQGDFDEAVERKAPGGYKLDIIQKSRVEDDVGMLLHLIKRRLDAVLSLVG